MFGSRKRDRTLAECRADIDALAARLDGLNDFIADMEGLYERCKMLHARLSKREIRASGEAPEPAPSAAVPTRMNPLAQALLDQARNGGG